MAQVSSGCWRARRRRRSWRGSAIRSRRSASLWLNWRQTKRRSSSLGVAKEFQRNGIARKLIDALARAAKRAEAKRVFLEVADDNIPALVLYSRVGFKEAGRRKAYYQRGNGATADALVLQLML